MLFFRSEESLTEWLVAHNTKRGATLTIPQLWELSQRWYRDRMSAEYHGRNLQQAQKIFTEVGLISEFWQAM